MYGGLFYGQAYYAQGSGRAVKHYTLDIADEVAVSENTLIKSVTKVFLDTATSVDILMRYLPAKVYEDVVGELVESFDYLMSVFVTLTDTVTAIEQSLIKSLTRAISDGVTGSETISFFKSQFRTLTDALTVTESFIRLQIRNLFDSISTYEKIVIRLNGSLIKWVMGIKTAMTYTIGQKLTGVWTKYARPNSSWTKTPKSDT